MLSLGDRIRTPEQQVEFLQEVRILPTSQYCEKETCMAPSDNLKRRPGTKYFYCECNTCHRQTSIRHGTILLHKGLSFRTFLLLAYFFSSLTLTHEQLIHECNLYDSGDDEEEVVRGREGRGGGEGGYMVGTGARLSCNTTVHYNSIFRFVLGISMHYC